LLQLRIQHSVFLAVMQAMQAYAPAFRITKLVPQIIFHLVQHTVVQWQ